MTFFIKFLSFYDESIEREERDVEGWRLLTWEEYDSFEPPIFDSDEEDDSDEEYDSDEEDDDDEDDESQEGGGEHETYDNNATGMIQH